MCLFCVLILPNCPLFVCVLNLIFIFQGKLVVLIRGMFRKEIINVSSNLKRGLHLETKIKSNKCLDIRTEGVVVLCFVVIKQ